MATKPIYFSWEKNVNVACGNCLALHKLIKVKFNQFATIGNARHGQQDGGLAFDM